MENGGVIVRCKNNRDFFEFVVTNDRLLSYRRKVFDLQQLFSLASTFSGLNCTVSEPPQNVTCVVYIKAEVAESSLFILLGCPCFFSCDFHFRHIFELPLWLEEMHTKSYRQTNELYVIKNAS